MLSSAPHEDAATLASRVAAEEGLVLARTNNSSGFRGVTKDSKTSNFRARARENGKDVPVGLFETAEEAALAYARFVKSRTASVSRRELNYCGFGVPQRGPSSGQAGPLEAQHVTCYAVSDDSDADDVEDAAEVSESDAAVGTSLSPQTLLATPVAQPCSGPQPSAAAASAQATRPAGCASTQAGPACKRRRATHTDEYIDVALEADARTITLPLPPGAVARKGRCTVSICFRWE